MPQAAASSTIKRRLAAILSADVKGYSRLMAADEEGTLRTLNAYRQEMDALIAGRDGRIVGTAGDSVLAEFPSAVEAARCAVEIQEELAERNAELPADRRLEFRIGINLGDVMVEGDDLFGDGINVAARLQALAEPGGIYISGGIHDQIKGKLPFGADFLGEQTVKNIAEPIRVYRLRSDRATVRRSIRGPLRRWLGIAAGLVLLAIVTAEVAWYVDPRRASGPVDEEQASELPLPDRPSIAVLPFDNLSDDPEEEYFADGLTDDLITDLSKISGLFIIARNSVFTYKDQAVDIREVARELGVRYVLEGSVRRVGSHVRINAQLIDGSTGNHLWAERYDREHADVFTVQDDVLEHIVEALSVQLTETEKSQVARLPTGSLEAYDYYLRAGQLAYRADADSTSDALTYYDKAIALDPMFADAYAGYARVATDILAYTFANTLPAAVARKRAYEAAGRALALNPQLSLGYSVLGLLQVLDGQHEEAIASARNAVALGPNSAEAYLNLAVVLVYAGLHGDALQAMATVLRLNPEPPRQVHEYRAFVLYMNGRYADALAALGREQDIATGHLGLEILAGANARLGRLDDARAAVKALLQRQPDISIAWYRVTFAHHAREQDLNDRLEALRLAGLPEWPYGVEGDPAHQLKGEAIDASTFGRTWAGERVGFGPFLQYVEADGTFVERGPSMQVTGTASRQGDLLCLAFPAVFLGRPMCGPIYRDPTGSPDEQDEYIYLNAYHAKRFSITQ